MNEVELLKQTREELTGSTATTSTDHAYVHAGKAFSAIIKTGSISAPYRFAFKTPSVASGKFIHWRPIRRSSSADYVELSLQEGDTYTGGTPVVPFNRNRLSSNVSQLQALVQGVTSTPVGIEIDFDAFGSAGGPTSKSGGSGPGEDEELVLDQDTVYVGTVAPTGATKVGIKLFWYEEDKGLDID